MIDKSFIEKELTKIAFFVQHSGFFDEFPDKIKAVFEKLPIEWEAVDTAGEIVLKWQDTPTWETASLKGKLSDKPIEIKVKRDSSRYIYKVFYEKSEYPTSSLQKLKAIIENLTSGKEPTQKLMQSTYDLIKKNQSEYVKFAKEKALKDVSEKDWKFKLYKDINGIYLRFYIDLFEQEEEKNNIDEKLKEHNYYRIDTIGTFLKKKIEKENIDITNIKFYHKPISLPNQAGFVLTINYKA